MKIGILGLAQSGKSTLFQIMTGINSNAIFGEKYVEGIAKVPDKRFSKLVDIFKPEKISPALISFVDVNASGENAWDTIRQSLSNVDGIVHIIDGFTNPDIDEIINKYQTLTNELILSDLVIVENRIERLKKKPLKAMNVEEKIQTQVIHKAKEHLENGKSLNTLKLNTEEENSIRGFTFWSIKPELVVINTSEQGKKLADEFVIKTKTEYPVINICCQIESEIVTLAPNEQKEFLDSMGIETPAYEKIIQNSFCLLDKIVYFTVGKDEVKAWVISANSTAPKAASAIHKDFERGFIKAEVVSYENFINNGQSLASAKAAGKVKLEGKEYIVADADIINFRFNV